MRYFIIFIELLFLCGSLKAQVLAQYNLYPFNPGFANPAATGAEACLVVALTDMHQWIGIKNAPNLQSLSINKGIAGRNSRSHGLGMNVIRDINGASHLYSGEIIYAYHALINREKSTLLSLGLSTRMEQFSLDESEFSPIYDPEITGNNVTTNQFNAGAGIRINNPRYFAGLAIYNFLPVASEYGTGYGGDRYHLSVQGGYVVKNPKAGYKIHTEFQGNLSGQNTQLDFIAKLLLSNDFWFGITFRKYTGRFDKSGQNLILYTGYHLKNWEFIYCYNADINSTQFHHYGSHQIAINYKLCSSDKSCPAYH